MRDLVSSWKKRTAIATVTSAATSTPAKKIAGSLKRRERSTAAPYETFAAFGSVETL